MDKLRFESIGEDKVVSNMNTTTELYRLCLDIGLAKRKRIKRAELLSYLKRPVSCLAIKVPSDTSVRIPNIPNLQVKFTGVRDKQTLYWNRYMLNRTTSEFFDLCIIQDVDILTSALSCQKIFNSKRLFITEYVLYPIQNGYKYIGIEKLSLNEEVRKFHVYSKSTVKTVVPLKLVPIDLETVVEDPRITVKAFKELTKNPEFLEAYRSSLADLYRRKLVIYSRALVELRSEIKKRKDISIQLALQNIPEFDIKKQASCLGFVLFAAKVEEFLEKIRFAQNALKSLDLAKVFTEVFVQFDKLTGRKEVKKMIVNILLAFSRSFKTFTNYFQNFLLTGPSGVGKTAMAKMIGAVFAVSKLFIEGTVTIVSRSDLVGAYVGDTALKTKDILINSLEGVLFIDEAYQLAGTGRDYGPEAITEIVNFLDKYIGLSCVIIAGYKEEMENRFLPTNEGLARRFPYNIDLKPYSVEELSKILFGLVEVEEELKSYLYSIITALNQRGLFEKQAGDILNLAQRMNILLNSSVVDKREVINYAAREFMGTKSICTSSSDVRSN